MAGNGLFFGLTIGLLGGAKVEQGLGRIGQAMSDFKKNADAYKTLHGSMGEAVKLTRALSNLERQGAGNSRAAQHLRDQLTQQTRALRAAGVDVKNLSGEYARLGRAMQNAGRLEKGQAQLGQAWSATKSGLAVAATMALPTMKAMDFQAQIRDMAITGGFSGTQAEAALGETVRKTSTDTGQTTGAINTGLGELVAGGVQSAQELSFFAPLMGRAATAWNTEMSDLARVVLTGRDTLGIAAQDMKKTFNILGAAGKEGQFEFKQMAKWMPQLGASFKSLGLQGTNAAAEMGAWLQVAKMGAGSTDEAANNFANFLNKLTSPDARKDFERAGIDIEARLKEAAARGVSPIEAMLGVIQEYMASKSPAAAKEFDAAMNLKDAKEREMALQRLNEAYALGDLFQDVQAMNFIRPALANLDKYRAIKLKALAEEGALDKDFKLRMETSRKKWDAVSGQWELMLTRVGDALRPLTDWVADLGTAVFGAASKFMAAYPGISKVLGTTAGLLAGIGVGYAAVKTLLGVYNVVKGLLALGTLKRFAPMRGLLPGGLGGAAEAVLGGGVQKVFVVNMPGGLPSPLGGGAGGEGNLPGGGGKPGGAPAPTGTTKPAGRLARMGTAVKNAGGKALALGKKALPLASRALAVPAAAYTGWEIGTALNDHVINPAVEKFSGGKNKNLGGAIYDWTHPAKPAPARPVTPPAVAPAARRPETAKPHTAAAGYAITVNINGTGLSVAQVRDEILRALEAWVRRQQAGQRASLHDGALMGAR